MAHFREWIEFVSQGIEGMAVAIMVSIILVGTTRWLFGSAKGIEGAYERYREMLGKTLQVGLEPDRAGLAEDAVVERRAPAGVRAQGVQGAEEVDLAVRVGHPPECGGGVSAPDDA